MHVVSVFLNKQYACQICLEQLCGSHGLSVFAFISMSMNLKWNETKTQDCGFSDCWGREKSYTTLNKHSPIRQCLQDGGHKNPGDCLVKNGVTDAHDVDHSGGAQDREHVGGHALPKVQQEALDLETPKRGGSFSQHHVQYNLRD